MLRQRPGGNSPECLATAGAGAITCDENADCPTDQQCSITDGPLGFEYACAATGACSQASKISHSYPICKSFSITPASACGAGTSCTQYWARSPTSFEVCK